MALEASQIYPGCETFSAEFDDDGVYFYQAYNSEIADYAIEHQKLGGANYNTGTSILDGSLNGDNNLIYY